MNAPQLPVKDSAAKTADDVLDLFKVDDKENEEVIPKKEPKEKEEKEEKEEEPEDLELIDEDEDEEDDEKLNLKNDDFEVNAPPRKAEILKLYPDLFKKIPFLEKMLYRDKAYTELFGSFDDAKELAEKAEIFNTFERDLLSGNTEDVLKNIKEADPKAFDKVVDGYLTTLHKVDKEAYFEVVDRVNKTLIMSMFQEAKDSDSEELQQAALLVNQFLYGTSKFTPSKLRAGEKESEEKNEVESERLAFVQERFETTRDELQGQVDNILKSTIAEYIDPRGNMTSYEKKNAVRDALTSLHGTLSSDSSMRNNLDKLWRAAFDAKFSKDSISKIKSFYLGKAKPNLRSVIMKARAEALKDRAPRKEKEEVEEETPRKRQGLIVPGRAASQKKETSGMRKGESVQEFLARD